MDHASKVLAERFAEAKTALNSKLSIQDFLAEQGIRVESNRQICCPLHDDSTPSFSVNLTTNEWKCFGCPDGGHYIDLWQKYNNKHKDTHYTIYTAVEALLREHEDICAELGFNTIYQDYDSEFNLFAQTEQKTYMFDELLARKEHIQTVNTESLKDVMDVLRTADVDRIVEFVSDCELGMSDSDLVDKYVHGKSLVTDYIQNILKNDEEVICDFEEALKD